MSVKTIQELDEWMTQNCYSDAYVIGDRSIVEGFGLDKFGSLYVWYYTERGERRNLNYFDTEEKAVEFAFEIISKDRFAQSHLVGFVKEPSNKSALLDELVKREIEFWTDEIPSFGFKTIRVFVLGCDIKKALDLKQRYGGDNQ